MIVLSIQFLILHNAKHFLNIPMQYTANFPALKIDNIELKNYEYPYKLCFGAEIK